MATPRQLEANRRNARRSTGPRTPEGKARIRLNALKHGLLAADTVLPGEDSKAFAEFLAGFEAEQRPATIEEMLLVHRAVSAHWRLRRLNRVETGIFTREFEDARAPDLDADEEPSDPAGKYERDTRLLGLTFVRNTNTGDSLSKLARYEAALDRKFVRSLDRLHYFQALRAQNKPSPLSGLNKKCETKPISPPARGRKR